MNKKNIILKLFSFVVVAFVLLLSVFTFIPQKNNNINSVSAASDTTVNSYRFNGSEIMLNSFVQYSLNYYDAYASILNIKISLYSGNVDSGLYDATPTYIFISGNSFDNNNNNGSFATASFNLNRALISGSTITGVASIPSDNWVGNDNSLLGGSSVNLTKTFALWNSGSNYPYLCGVSLSNENFISNISSVTIGLRSDPLVLPDVTIRDSDKLFYIRYFDVNNNYIDFEFYTQSNYEYSTRSYIFANGLSDNQLYNEGYNAGLSANQDNIYNQGFNAGKIDGYNQGFNAGIDSANDYSFTGLFGAVIDAPVRVFSDLFNFNLLGVNLLSFITGLISLVVVIYIVKVCVGGK